MGARCYYSAIDALLAILTPISSDLAIPTTGKLTHPPRPSLLAHDIEGAFNNTNPSLLLQVMQQQNMPQYLLAWTRAFTTNRTLAFSFDQQLETPKPFRCGLPQGSPASPILFLIYANAMLEVTHQPGRELTVSYVDDTGFLQSANSKTFALQRLKERMAYHTERGKHLGLRFSPPKSELLHCLPSASHHKIVELSTLPQLSINDQIITPTRSIKYLGIKIDESLTFTQHALRAASAGKATLGSLLFLRHRSNGLNTHMARHLILTLILPKMLWASPAWWTGKDTTLRPLATAYHSAVRWATGLPLSTNIPKLLTCAHLPPLHTYLDYLSARCALRLLFLPPSHPLSGLPRTPKCPTTAPGISQLRRHIQHLLIGPIEDRSAAATPFSISNTTSPNNNKHDEPSKRHNQWLSTLPPNTFLLYTDGSKLDDGRTGAGATLYQTTPNGLQHIRTHSYNIGPRCEVFDAELHATAEGLQLLTETTNTPTTLYLCLDNQAAITTLLHNEHNHQYAHDTLRQAADLTKNGWTITTIWTPSHTNITGNDLADTLAKAGAHSATPCPSTITTEAWLRAQVRQNFLNKWRDEVPDCLPPSFTYPKHLQHLPFPTSRALFRIRCGRTPCDPWKDEDATDCPCGTGTISSHHYLFECTDLHTEREQLRLATSTNFTIPQLLKDRMGVATLLSFAKNTGLGYSTRVQRRTTPLGDDKEKMDMGIAQLGFAAFDG
jgi:ribonuclease HI